MKYFPPLLLLLNEALCKEKRRSDVGSENVQSGLKSGVLTITLNHPKANAFTEEMIFSIQKIFKDPLTMRRFAVCCSPEAGTFSAQAMI